MNSYEERSTGSGGDAQACAFVELATANGQTAYGVGMDGNIVSRKPHKVKQETTLNTYRWHAQDYAQKSQAQC